MKKVIIVGSTGMVGKGVLIQCLESTKIEEVLVVNRNSLNRVHPKLKEILLKDFLNIGSRKDDFIGFDACFYTMGVSSVGMSEENYSIITYNITKAFVDAMYDANPNMVFNYVSGVGTDSSEKGRTMWARVKGKTENMIFARGFMDAYAFRPGAIIPEKGIKSKTGWYNMLYVILRPFFPLVKKLKNVTTTTKLGDAMINSLNAVQSSKILHNREINVLGQV
jgi:nucleoside-diphosphate-sugar epimerase